MSDRPSLLRRAYEMELTAWRSMYRWARRRPVPLAPGETAFGYVGVIRPILGVFIGLSAVEIPIFDLIVTHLAPWRPARWIVLGLGVWGLLWMIGFLATMTIHPHAVGPAGIRVRHGASTDFLILWSDIESVTKRYRSLPTNKSVQVEQDGDRRMLHIAVGRQTSIDVRLRRPISFLVPNGPTEPIDEIHLYADDADGFTRGHHPAPTA